MHCLLTQNARPSSWRGGNARTQPQEKYTDAAIRSSGGLAASWTAAPVKRRERRDVFRGRADLPFEDLPDQLRRPGGSTLLLGLEPLGSGRAGRAIHL